MEPLGFVFGLMGMSLGAMRFIFGIICMGKLGTLEKQLKESGVLKEQTESDDK